MCDAVRDNMYECESCCWCCRLRKSSVLRCFGAAPGAPPHFGRSNDRATIRSTRCLMHRYHARSASAAVCVIQVCRSSGQHHRAARPFDRSQSIALAPNKKSSLAPANNNALALSRARSAGHIQQGVCNRSNLYAYPLATSFFLVFANTRKVYAGPFVPLAS